MLGSLEILVAIFRLEVAVSQKRFWLRRLLLITNRKSYTRFRLVLKSMTLDDLEQPLRMLYVKSYQTLTFSPTKGRLVLPSAIAYYVTLSCYRLKRHLIHSEVILQFLRGTEYLFIYFFINSVFSYFLLFFPSFWFILFLRLLSAT